MTLETLAEQTGLSMKDLLEAGRISGCAGQDSGIVPAE